MIEVVVDNWSYKTCKAPVKSSPPTNQHPVLFTGWMPFLSPNQQCQRTEGTVAITNIFSLRQGGDVFTLFCLFAR